MFTIIKNARVYAPKDLGHVDLLIGYDKVMKIGKNLEDSFREASILDMKGKIVVPGFIDQHVHITGGGGEAGFYSRTPEVKLSEVIKGGITTVVGLLGTDGTTRSVESLFAKAKGLEKEGISTYMLTGSYEMPTQTLTGSVKKDVMFLDKVLGVKIAMSDHRSSHVTYEALLKLASTVRVAGMLSGKIGIVVMHMGDEEERLDKVIQIIKNTGIPPKHFLPTHVSRNYDLLQSAIEYGKLGGRIDITAYGVMDRDHTEVHPTKAVKRCIEEGVALENITMSSDGNGSMPIFDENKNLVGMGVGSLRCIHLAFLDLVKEQDMKIEDALQVITSNVAKGLGIYPKKGCIQEGSDADVLILDEGLDIKYVFAKGKCMIEDEKIMVKGTFE